MHTQLTVNGIDQSTPLQAVIDASPAPPARIAVALFSLLFNLSAAGVARHLDVDPATLSRAMNSTTANGQVLRDRLASILGVDIYSSRKPAKGFPAPPSPSINEQNQQIAINEQGNIRC